MKLGCIADDFTGATDLAGLLARSNASVRLHFGLPSVDQASTADIEIIALKCRTSPVTEAVQQCLEAGQWLLKQGAQQLYWKYCSTFDSTAEGNIGPVAEALMALTGQSQALYCPAFPENGRTVFMGHLFVGTQLLSESSLKDHPLTPMTDANLCRVLAPQVQGTVGLWDRLSREKGAPRPTATHLIADAIDEADLAWLIAHSPQDVLLTGGSALALSLPEHLGLGASAPEALPRPAPKALVLSGSCSEMTRAQVATWADSRPAYALNPLDPDTVASAIAWWDQQPDTVPCLIYATASPAEVQSIQDRLGAMEAGHRIEQALAAVAEHAVEAGVQRLVVAGGETSGAVTQRLGVTAVRVGPEICPGVPWVYTTRQERPLALALKSGNFGDRFFFFKALEQLDP